MRSYYSRSLPAGLDGKAGGVARISDGDTGRPGECGLWAGLDVQGEFKDSMEDGVGWPRWEGAEQTQLGY